VTTNYPTPEEQKRFIRAYVSHKPHFNDRTTAQTPTLVPASPGPPIPNVGPPVASSPRLGPSSSISSFMLDSRAPSAGAQKDSVYEEEERAREEQVESEVRRLMKETRLWRVANTVQWVAWGIVQAKVEGMEQAILATKEKQDADGRKPEDLAVDAKMGGLSLVESPSNMTATEEIKGLAGAEHLVHDTAMEAGEVADEDAVEQEEEFDYLAYAQDRALFFWGDLLELGLVREAELPEELRQRAKRLDY